MGRTSSIDAAAARRLDLALQRNPTNISAAAREAGVGKHAAQRYVAKLKATGQTLGPSLADQLTALDTAVLALRTQTNDLGAALDAIHRHIESIKRTL